MKKINIKQNKNIKNTFYIFKFIDVIKDKLYI